MEIRTLSIAELHDSEEGRQTLKIIETLYETLKTNQIPAYIAVNALGLLLGDIIGQMAPTRDAFDKLFVGLCVQISSMGSHVFDETDANRSSGKTTH